MRREVPQYIDIEDKLFGPLTFRQAIYLAGSGGASIILFFILDKLPIDLHIIIKLVFASPFLALGLALAFIKINNRPFIFTLEAWFYYMVNSKRYIWKKKNKEVKDRQKVNLKNNEMVGRVDKNLIPKVSRSKLRNLAWSLDMENK